MVGVMIDEEGVAADAVVLVDTVEDALELLVRLCVLVLLLVEVRLALVLKGELVIDGV